MQAYEMFKLCYPRSVNLELVHKAAVAAGSTTDATFAGPLALANPLADAFLSMLRPRTLLGRIPGLRQVPFNVSVPQQTAAGTYGWVGQGAPMVVTKGDFATLTLGGAKAGGMIVVTKELAELSSPGADVVLRDELINGIAQFLDVQLIDPTVAAVANVSPASITNGTTAITSAGTSQANAATDLQALLTQFVAANPDIESLVLLMKPANAVAIARATNTPTLGLTGGTIYGIPVVTSGSVGDRLIALDAQGILYADDGALEISASQSATVQMDSVPADPTVAATVLVSLYQRNLVGFRGVRWINWLRSATSSVKYVSGAAYV
jgi:HK97 family phage major capsid protein